MSVGLILITHNHIGEEVLQTAVTMLGHCPLNTEALAIGTDVQPDRCLQRAKSALSKVDQGDGVLVLTDLFGSSPSNIACRLEAEPKLRIISGLNLPMLVRVFNYAHLPLERLADKAESGGRDGVIVSELAATRK